MNRIYQGRLSRAQLLDANGGDVAPPDWDCRHRPVRLLIPT